MAVSEKDSKQFLEKMGKMVAAKPQAPLRVVDESTAVSLATPAAKPAKKPAYTPRTMSFKLSEEDYQAIEEAILDRKKQGEKRFKMYDAGREMVRDWLLKHGKEVFDYKGTKSN